MRYCATVFMLCILICSTEQRNEELSTFDKALQAHFSKKESYGGNKKEHSPLPDITNALVAILATDKTAFTPMALFLHLTHVSNAHIFFRLVKESKINKKSDVIKMYTSFLNPKNLTPQGIVTTMKRFDSDTTDELTGVWLQYFREVVDKHYGNKYDIIIKYLNDDDVRKFAKILFAAMKETNTDDLVWIFNTMKKETKVSQENADRIIRGETDAIVNEWEQTDEKVIRGKINNALKNIRKLHTFNKLEDHIKDLTDVFKHGSSNFFSLLLSDIQNALGEINPQKAANMVIEIFEEEVKFLNNYMESSDPEKIGRGVQLEMQKLQNLNHSDIKETIDKLKTRLPEIEGFIAGISDDTINKTLMNDVLIGLQIVKVPDELLDLWIDAFLTMEKKIDANKLRTFVEFLAKYNKIDSKVYKVLQDVTLTVIKDAFTKNSNVNLTSKTMNDLKENMLHQIERVNSSQVERLFKDTNEEMLKVNDLDISNSIVDVNNIVKDFYQIARDGDFDDLKNVTGLINKSTVKHVVHAVLDFLKIMNSTKFETYCDGSVETTQDFRHYIANATAELKSLIMRVGDGEEVLKMLKYDAFSSFLYNILDNADLKKICSDITEIITSIKHFNSEAMEEIVNVSWDLFVAARNISLHEEKNESNVSELLEILRAVQVVASKRMANDFVTELLQSSIKTIEELNKS